MFLGLLCLALLAYLTYDVNFAYGRGSATRALYVDEGFYSDAAQNLIKTGQWGMHHDSRHWPGSPMTLVLQSIAFKLFGANVLVARMLAAFLVLIGAWALYSIAKTRFPAPLSALLVFSTISTISYVTLARAAVTDPMAMVMFLLAVWAFVSMKNRTWAIPLSLMFGFLAFFSKMYFIFAIATIIALWLGELWLRPVFLKQKIQWSLLRALLYSLLVIAAMYISYRLYFSAEIDNFLAINSNKRPVLELDRLLRSQRIAFQLIPKNTQSPVFLYALMLTALYLPLHWLVTKLVLPPEKQVTVREQLEASHRADWAMGLFLVSGLLTVGMLSLLKTHYHYFAITPIAFLALAAVYHVSPHRLAAYFGAAVLIAHMLFQVSAYREWIERPQSTSIDRISREVAAEVHRSQAEGLIPVIGEFSAQLGLYSPRIISIDAKWISQKVLCERLDYWRPLYHVNLVWDNSWSRRMLGRIAACPSVSIQGQKMTYKTLPLKNDYVVLTRLAYARPATTAPVPSIYLLQ